MSYQREVGASLLVLQHHGEAWQIDSSSAKLLHCSQHVSQHEDNTAGAK